MTANSNGLPPVSNDPRMPRDLIHKQHEDSRLSTCQCAAKKATDGSTDDGNSAPRPPERPDDPDLDQIVLALIRTLVDLLEPDDGDIFWRSDVLGQPLSQIARETGLGEAEISERLPAMRSEIVRLLILTLQPPADT